MKKIILAAILFNMALAVKAQDEIEVKTGGFKKENLFTGGNVTAYFSNGITNLGVTPYFGYSITKWLDAAASFNFSYISQRDEYDNKQRQTLLAPGAFVRIFPVQFLYAQAGFEHNFITQKNIPATAGGASDKVKKQVNSLLLVIGYASGRELYNKSYYFISLSFDALKLAGSPYVTTTFDNVTHSYPIFNAGFNIALFQGRRRNF
jgi:hypothetical protein